MRISPTFLVAPPQRILAWVICLCGMALSQGAANLPLIAVMPLEGQEGLEPGASKVVTDALSDALVKTGRVRVMERSQIESILQEQGFQQSGACSGGECAVEVGKLLSIDKMVVGSLGKLGESYSFTIRLVNVETGEILGSSRRMQRGEIDGVVTQVLPGVAQELVAALPQVAGGDPSKVSDAPVPSRPIPEPSSPSQEVQGSVRWGWWLAGGAVVAGGAAAAVLLMRDTPQSEPSIAPVASNQEIVISLP